MPLTIFVGVLTLAPAVFALVVLGLGVAKQARSPLVLAAAVLGLLLPALFLLLAPDTSLGGPTQVVLFNGASPHSASFTPSYRFDAFGFYAALGVAFLVAPLGVWLAWQGSPQAADARHAERFVSRMLARPNWVGVALALGLESAALTLVLADNIILLGVAWVVLAGLAWGLGEVGSELATLDRPGLGLMLAGPVAWTVVMVFASSATKTLSLLDLMGHGGFSTPGIILLALALALAGGAYPFTVWVRRRAALIAPAGLAAVVLALVPVVLFVGARTYSAAENLANQLPEIGKATPPLTAGLAFAVLGGVTVGVVGLLALDRRDVRAVIAFLAVAQVGWALLALGVGQPVSLLGLTVLMATSVLGLGAMLAAAFAGGTLTGDVEPDGAGPRPFGVATRPVTLGAWCIGAATLLGVPLFGGFISRQMISAAALHTGGLTIPLVAIAWAGDALLFLAVLRMTVPAFTQLAANLDVIDDEDDEDDEDDMEVMDSEDLTLPAAPVTARPLTWGDLPLVPVAILGALALLTGIVPQLLLSWGVKLAASALVQVGALDRDITVISTGYTTGTGAWLSTLVWLAVVVLVVLLVLLLPGEKRVVKPLLHQTLVTVDDEAEPEELVGLPATSDAWSELSSTFASEWLLPGGHALLAGTDDDDLPAGDDERADDDDTGSEDDADLSELEVEEITVRMQGSRNANDKGRTKGRGTAGDEA